MAGKDLINRTAMANAVNTKTWNKLRAYSKDTGIPISKLLDKAIEYYLKFLLE